MGLSIVLILFYDTYLFRLEAKVTKRIVEENVLDSYLDKMAERKTPMEAKTVVNNLDKKNKEMKRDVKIWTGKYDDYMLKHREQFQRSFSRFDSQTDDIDQYNENTYTIYKGSRILASIGTMGDYTIVALGKDAEYDEKEELPSLEVANKECEKLLDYFQLSYQTNENLWAKGIYNINPDSYKQAELFYEKTVDDIPVYDNGYLVEYRADGIYSFSGTSHNDQFLIIEDQVKKNIAADRIISSTEAKKKFEDQLMHYSNEDKYTELSIENCEFYYYYSEESDELIPGWLLSCKAESYDFTMEQWNCEDVDYFCDAEGTSCIGVGNRKWLNTDFVEE